MLNNHKSDAQKMSDDQLSKEYEKERDEACKSGKHKFVQCDEWGRTCSWCGKNE